MANILITVPNMGWIHKSVTDKLVELSHDSRHKVAIITAVADPPLDNNLNLLAEGFYSSELGFDFWLNLDDDTAPLGNPLDLAALDRDVIGLPVPVAREGHSSLFYVSSYDVDSDGVHTPLVSGEGLREVGAIGGGAFLVSRRVFDCMEMRKHPFLSIYNEKGHRLLGPDLSFSKRLRENGFKLYTHFGYPCKHFKEVNIGRFVGVM